ncbi:hypothetical protein N9J26_01445 [bacterium]|nr:hypothetical protein [bacterium]
MNTAGIIIQKLYNGIGGLENALNSKLESTEKTQRLGRVFFMKESTLVVTEAELAIDAYNIDGENTITFTLSSTVNSCSINICKNNVLVKTILSLNDERIESFDAESSGSDEVEDESDFITVNKIIEKALGASISFVLSECQYETIDIDQLKSDSFSIPSKSTSLPQPSGKRPEISKITDNELELDYYFERLSDKDESKVQALLESLDDDTVNKSVLSYILNLAHFHWSIKIRRRAMKLVEKYSSETLWSIFNSTWDKKNLTQQEYSNAKLLNCCDVDASEYLVFSQVTRKNYFEVKPKRGMVEYMSMRYRDEAENIFDCYNVGFKSVSERILKLQNLGSITFRNAPNIDWEDTIGKLSQLQNLHFLQIARCGLETVPDNLSALVALKTLILEEPAITSFPEDLLLPNLSCLDVKFSGVSVVDFKYFPAVTELWIDNEKSLERIDLKNLDHEVRVTNGDGRFAFSKIISN